MTDILNKIDQHIGVLNLSSPDDVRLLFEEVRSRFLAELGSTIDPKVLEDVRVRWIGRSERSIRRRVLANWLKVDSPLRQQIGKNFQELLSDRKSTRLNSSHLVISYAVFCLKKKK